MTLLSLFLDAAPGGGIFGGTGGMLLMMALLFGIMYFFMIRPQQKKQKELQKARESISKGDRVLTAGGIHGKVKEVKDTYFVIEVSEGVTIKVEKTSVFISAEAVKEESK